MPPYTASGSRFITRSTIFFDVDGLGEAVTAEGLWTQVSADSEFYLFDDWPDTIRSAFRAEGGVRLYQYDIPSTLHLTSFSAITHERQVGHLVRIDLLVFDDNIARIAFLVDWGEVNMGQASDIVWFVRRRKQAPDRELDEVPDDVVTEGTAIGDVLESIVPPFTTGWGRALPHNFLNVDSCLVLPVSPEDGGAEEAAIKLSRGYGCEFDVGRNVTEANRHQTCWLRENRIVGVSSEGSAAVTWPSLAEVSNRYFDCDRWPYRFLADYCLTADFCRYESRLVSRLAATISETVGGFSSTGRRGVRNSVEHERFAEVAGATQRLVSRALLALTQTSIVDAGDVYDRSMFLEMCQDAYSLSVARLELRHAISDALKLVESVYSAQVTSRLDEANERRQRQSFVLSVLTIILIPATLVSGFLGMNTQRNFPSSFSFWDSIALATAISGVLGTVFGMHALIVYWRERLK